MQRGCQVEQCRGLGKKVRSLKHHPSRQFHFRLAAHLGWHGDVDALIKSLEAGGQLLEWQSMAIIDGWYDGPWTHTAHLLATIHNSAMRLIGAQVGADHKEVAESMVNPDELIQAQVRPPKKQKTKSTKKMAPAQAEKILTSLYA